MKSVGVGMTSAGKLAPVSSPDASKGTARVAGAVWEVPAPQACMHVGGMSCSLHRDLADTTMLDLAATAACDLLREVPLARWSTSELPGRLDTGLSDRSRHGAFVDGAQLFDHHSFHMSVSEAAATDPQQRLVLACGYAALHAKGLCRAELTGSGAGVAVGIYSTEFAQVLGQSPRGRSVYASTGASLSIACGRVSFVLGLQGPCASY